MVISGNTTTSKAGNKLHKINSMIISDHMVSVIWCVWISQCPFTDATLCSVHLIMVISGNTTTSKAGNKQHKINSMIISDHMVSVNLPDHMVSFFHDVES